MVGAQWRGEPVESSLDQGLLINGHRHGLAHFQVAGQHRVVKVEVHGLEVRAGGSSDERVILETLVRLPFLQIQESAESIEPACRSLRIASGLAMRKTTLSR